MQETDLREERMNPAFSMGKNRIGGKKKKDEKNAAGR